MCKIAKDKIDLCSSLHWTALLNAMLGTKEKRNEWKEIKIRDGSNIFPFFLLILVHLFFGMQSRANIKTNGCSDDAVSLYN